MASPERFIGAGEFGAPSRGTIPMPENPHPGPQMPEPSRLPISEFRGHKTTHAKTMRSPQSSLSSGQDLSVKVGTTYIGNAEVRVVEKFKSRPPRQAVTSTARHEAKHAAIKPDLVKLATIVPGPGYLGKVETYRFDPIIAMASNDEAGNGYDRWITRMMGFNESDCASEANENLNKKIEHVDAIGHALDQKKTLTGSEIRSIMNKVDEEKNKPPVKKADVFISDTNGGQRKIENVDIKGGKVNVPIDLEPGKWTSMPGKPTIAG
jgi:hypothetical protein